jgi:hypothetical protein
MFAAFGRSMYKSASHLFHFAQDGGVVVAQGVVVFIKQQRGAVQPEAIAQGPLPGTAGPGQTIAFAFAKVRAIILGLGHVKPAQVASQQMLSVQPLAGQFWVVRGFAVDGQV